MARTQKHMIVLTHDQVHEQIPYMLIAETVNGSRWGLTKRKALWKQWFTDAERRKLYKMIYQINNWALVKGVPDVVYMEDSTSKLYRRLGNFCLNL